MNKDSFVFRREWMDAISGLPGEVRLEIYEGIIEYATTGTIPDLKQMAMLAFNLTKRTIDMDTERYQAISRKRAEAGRKHKGNQYTNGTNGTNGTKWNKRNKVEQNGTNGTDNDIISSNEDLIISNNNLTVSANAEPASLKPTHGVDPKRFMVFFNETVAGSAIPPIKTMNKTRCAMVNARVKEHGEDALRETVRKAAESSFLNGGGDRCFVATFDWIFKPTNFPKVLEGNYDNIRYHNNGNANNSIRENVDDAKRCAINSTQAFIAKARGGRDSL